jgi:tmRNA-binding protein
MEKGLKWHQKVGLELLWFFSLITSYTPRFFKYYILKPIVAFILRISGYRYKVIKTNLRNSFPHKNEKEINKIAGKVTMEGLTLIPTKVYFVDALVKVEFAIAKGKKLYDKREDLKRKDLAREEQKVLKTRY